MDKYPTTGRNKNKAIFKTNTTENFGEVAYNHLSVR